MPRIGTAVESADATFGRRIMALADALAEISESPNRLACTYLTLAHRTVANTLRDWMQAAGMSVTVDAVGNVTGRYASPQPGARTLMVGSHYDTVLNAGKYDGRLGILTALVAVEDLHRTGCKLPFHVDVVAFSEEEGVRFAAPYLGSSAVAGRFDMNLLPRRDAGGVGLGDALEAAGFDPADIPKAARNPKELAGYLEVHIEQGPILLLEDLPLGIVTSIAGAVRYVVTVTGEAGHAGTVPMASRHDAAAAAAEIVLSVERHARGDPALVGTVGRLQVPNGATNVIPGRVDMSMELRADTDAKRDRALADVLADIEDISRRRGVTVDVKETVRTPAVPCAPRLQKMFADAVTRAGVAPRFLASGAGHDAVMLSNVTDVGMLFVRCGNGGVSHSPREIITAEDADLAARVLLDVLTNFGTDHGPQ